ncbi:peptidoglycan-binding protein [Advenella faeciporci]|uniref:Peptidoglycan-binding protein n=1 Tax=Advenella faeciporci TaxID=797535 RepID=A0A918JRD1_9BURK|nr:FecR domain-containing protein [Advenella faeciporci]GGW96942.1 peptidoglycan-binding protein [Advenella faeciporci]
MKINTLISFLLLNITALLMHNAQAQPAGAHGNNFLYQIKHGETLSSLSETFTTNQSNWQAIKRNNYIANTRKIPTGMTLRIPFTLIDEVPDQATIIYLTGNVLVNNRLIGKNHLISEADTITTGKQSNITFALSDESKVQIPPDSTVFVERLRKFRGTGLIDSIFNIESGKLAAHASPNKTGVGRFEIRTPVSITGVRGTVVRAEASPQAGSSSELLNGKAAFIPSASSHQSVHLNANQGITANNKGQAGDIIELLPPPEIRLSQSSPFAFKVTILPVSGATAYLVRVSNDISGYDVLYTDTVRKPETSVTGPGKGTYYVSVRSIDSNQLAGADAVQPFTITATGIMTESGVSIGTQSGPLLQRQY